MEHLGSQWMDFHEIRYSGIFCKCVQGFFFSQSYLHLDIIKVFFHQVMHKRIALKGVVYESLPARCTTRTHNRLQYAAIILTTFVWTSTVEPYFVILARY